MRKVALSVVTKVAWTVGDRHPFRVILCQAYRGLTGGFFCSSFSVLLFFCESSCLLYLSFNFDLYVSKIMHS